MEEKKDLRTPETTDEVVEDTKAEQTSAELATKDKLTTLLAQYGVGDTALAVTKLDELGVECVADLAALSAEELVGVGLKLVKARKLLEALNSKAATAGGTSAARVSSVTTTSRAEQINTVVLPEPPNEESWLSSLRSGGVLKVGESTYLSAARAIIAAKLNVKDLIKRLCEEIEQTAVAQDEVVPQLYFDLRNRNLRRKYSEVFAVVGGASAITEAQRASTMRRIQERMVPALYRCHMAADAWLRTWIASTGPMMGAFAVGQQIGAPIGMSIPPAFNSMPDVAPIRDACDELRDAVNASLSGVGPAAVTAIACEYRDLQEILNNDSLPAYLGVATREQMLKKLDIGVGASLIRMERDLVRLLLAYASSDSQSPDQESSYYYACHMVGAQIPWNHLGIEAKQDTTEHISSVTGRNL